MRPSGTRHAWPAIAVLLALGLVARAFLALSPSFTLDADKGVVYLMALRQARGEATMIFWGQTYGGTLISTVSGLAMRLFGDSEQVVLGVTIVASLAGIAVLGRIILISLGRTATIVGVGLATFPGLYLLRQSVDDGGFYATSVLFALAAIWLAIDPLFVDSRWRAGAVGLVTGLAFWCSPMGLALAAPAALLVAQRAGWRTSLPPLTLGGLLGMLPFLQGTVTRIMQGDPSTGIANPFVDIPGRVFGLFFHLIPSAFPAGESALQVPIAIGVIGLLVLLTIESSRTVSVARDAARTVLLGVVFLFGLLLASGFGLESDARRYVTFLLPAFAFAASAGVVRFGRAARPLGMVLVVTAIAATSVVILAGSTSPIIDLHQTEGSESPSWPTPEGKFGVDADRIARILEDHGVSAGYASYWLSYRVTAASKERVVLSEVTESRFRPYLAAAAAASPTAIVVYSGTAEFDAIVSASAPPYTERIDMPGGVVIFLYSYRIPERTARTLLNSPES